jgi:hypothetical protein
VDEMIKHLEKLADCSRISEINGIVSHSIHSDKSNDENDDPDCCTSGGVIRTEHGVDHHLVNSYDKLHEKINAESIGDALSLKLSIVRPNIQKDICKEVIRCKLSKRRHLVLKEGINPMYLKEIFPSILANFKPQHVQYNGGIANITTWKISCYLEVMDHGIPTAHPNLQLKHHCLPLLNQCNDLFLLWYQQQHSCNTNDPKKKLRCHRLMTFITRYTPAPNEQALLKARKIRSI